MWRILCHVPLLLAAVEILAAAKTTSQAVRTPGVPERGAGDGGGGGGGHGEDLLRVEFEAAISSDTPSPRPVGENGVVHFDKVVSNVGHHYDVATSSFNVPADGIYTFIVDIHHHQRPDNRLADVHIVKDDAEEKIVCSILSNNSYSETGEDDGEDDSDKWDDRVHAVKWDFQTRYERDVLLKRDWGSPPAALWERSKQEGVPLRGVCDGVTYLRRGGRVYVRRHVNDDVVEDDVIAGGGFSGSLLSVDF